jgi:hypothetical protein
LQAIISLGALLAKRRTVKGHGALDGGAHFAVNVAYKRPPLRSEDAM